MALYRKYRPATFADVVGQEHVTDPLCTALDTGRISHAYLFSGPRGCGKTSSARILARSLNCVQGPTSTPCGTCASCVSLAPGGGGNLDVIELDAASHGGVDDTRELRDRAFYAPAESRYRVFIVDEAHMVTTAGFNALLKIVEEPPAHLIFVFATTEPEKVLPTIRSRTHHYPFRLLPPATMRGLLGDICEQEQVPVEEAVYPLVIRAGGGSPRDSLSVLDQLLAGAGSDGVTYARAVALLGVTDVALIDDAVDALAAGDGAALFRTVDRVMEAGHDPRRFAVDLLERLRDLILMQAVPDATERGLVAAPGDLLDRMRDQAARLGPATLTRSAELLHAGLGEMRGATAPRLLLEVVCSRMLLPAADTSEAATLQRLEQLERRVASGAVAAPAGPAPASADQPAAPARPAADPSRRRGAEALAALRGSKGTERPESATAARASAEGAHTPAGEGAGHRDRRPSAAGPSMESAGPAAHSETGGTHTAGRGPENTGGTAAGSGGPDRAGTGNDDRDHPAADRGRAVPAADEVDGPRTTGDGERMPAPVAGGTAENRAGAVRPESESFPEAGRDTLSAGPDGTSVVPGEPATGPSGSPAGPAEPSAGPSGSPAGPSGPPAGPRGSSPASSVPSEDRRAPSAAPAGSPAGSGDSFDGPGGSQPGPGGASAGPDGPDAEPDGPAGDPELLAAVEAAWSDIKMKVKESGATLGAMLTSGASVAGVERGEIVLAHHAALVQRLSQPQPLSVVRSAVAAVLGREHPVRWVVAGQQISRGPGGRERGGRRSGDTESGDSEGSRRGGPRRSWTGRPGSAAAESGASGPAGSSTTEREADTTGTAVTGRPGGRGEGEPNRTASGSGRKAGSAPRFSRPSQARGGGPAAAGASGSPGAGNPGPGGAGNPYDDIPPPDYPDLPDDPGPDDYGYGSGAVPPSTPEEEQEMFEDAARPVAPEHRRDPDEVALELLASELGATPLNG
ncbi:DNA polymerase III subunit gamma and tau [Nocardia sp. CA-290969]|uniref:DNA polymerase III subunit gamma and tau n=1 Tax=Nocardia sp. CA-290969 TaxID=3239986 RepID=UPI003D8B69DF